MTQINTRKYGLSLFVFRRDLRLYDNTSLIKASQMSQKVLPCFIFDPRQSKSNNQYFSHNCFQFMIESLKDLDKQIKVRGSKLYTFCGDPAQVLKKLVQMTGADAVFMNRDYTAFSFQRDLEIRKSVKDHGTGVISQEDLLLITQKELQGIEVKHKKFTPFYNKMKQFNVKKPNPFDDFDFYNQQVSIEQGMPEYDYNKHVPIRGGRAQGLKLLNDLPHNYANSRDDIKSNNSNLSAHNKFGTISIRQFYHKTKDENIRRSLHWRDFYYYAMMKVKRFSCMYEKYDQMVWVGKPEYLELWKNGQTGVPIVDAAMRELKMTGMIHNRLRMIVGSYLVKDLLISWKQGEKHFAHYLVDYDPSQNNGNWQWVASTGYDSQPYFRIFNPKNQTQKFDPTCVYIKKWVPELKQVPPKAIINWDKEYQNYNKLGYGKPIVDHATQKERCLNMYKKVNEKVTGKGGKKKQKQDSEEEAEEEEEEGEERRRRLRPRRPRS